MTPEEQNKLLWEANQSADEAIASAKKAIEKVEGLSAVVERSNSFCFERKETQFFSDKFEERGKPVKQT